MLPILEETRLFTRVGEGRLVPPVDGMVSCSMRDAQLESLLLLASAVTLADSSWISGLLQRV